MRTLCIADPRVLVACLFCSTAVAETYDFEATYTGEVVSNVSGGAATGARYLDNLDLTLEVDLNRAFGGAGTLFVYGLYNNGTTFADELVGDLQVTSNIDAPEAWRIYELWYEVGSGPWSVRTGLYDVNSEFDAGRASALFLNSSHGVGAALGQTGENGPSIFPVTSLAVRAAVETGSYVARLAVLDGVPGDPDDPSSNEIDIGGDDGALIVGEADVTLGESGRVWAGYWRYTAEFDRLVGSGAADGNDGWYLGAERELEVTSRPATVFVRYGRANEALNPIDDYLGAGIVVEGLVPDRPYDRVGFAVASAGAGASHQRLLEVTGVSATSRETAVELTWRAPLNEHVVLQPDLQWVRNPGASTVHDDALVLGLRFELSW